MGHALASEGGFCTESFFSNSGFIQDHHLDSKGYIFSASLPPYSTSVAMSALGVLEEHPNLIKQLNENITFLRAVSLKSRSLIQDGLLDCMWERVSWIERVFVYFTCKKVPFFLARILLLQFATALSFQDAKLLQNSLDESAPTSCEGLIFKPLGMNSKYELGKRNWLKLKKDFIESMWDSLDLVPIGTFYGCGKRTVITNPKSNYIYNAYKVQPNVWFEPSGSCLYQDKGKWE
ncbi:uncharacterized protein LOC141653230 isoform X2 [Silene latifolia]|uniref:uncharacterized protein LOC141653230 isoform X2 n=1 Tax=Silene latifolia TaxID=37657 RepID=UPI003D776F83